MTEVVEGILLTLAERCCGTCNEHALGMDAIDPVAEASLEHCLEILDRDRYLITCLNDGATWAAGRRRRRGRPALRVRPRPRHGSAPGQDRAGVGGTPDRVFGATPVLGESTWAALHEAHAWVIHPGR
jgi:hypothetical protein